VHQGTVAHLERALNREIVKVQCDLHGLNDSLLKAILATWGEHSLSTPSHIVQIAFELNWLYEEDLEGYRAWHERDISDQGTWPDFTRADSSHSLVTAPLFSTPVDTRWETILPAMKFIIENYQNIIKYCAYVHLYRKSTTMKCLGATAKRLHEQFVQPITIARAQLFVDFAVSFYEREYYWSKGTQSCSILF
jgi:hypothetical protein